MRDNTLTLKNYRVQFVTREGLALESQSFDNYLEAEKHASKLKQMLPEAMVSVKITSHYSYLEEELEEIE